jgi:hypothetical protein
MSYTRGSTLRGPAIITFGGQNIRTKGDIKVSVGIETLPIESSEYPQLDERMREIAIRLEFTPVGQVNADLLPVLFPALEMTPGDSLFGDTDAAAVITPLTGSEPLTLHCCAVTKMPDIIVSATKTTLGSMVITAILANGKEWNDVAARLTIAASGEVPAVGTLDPATIPTNAARIKWGEASPWNALSSREGVVVAFELQTDNDEVDEYGVVDMIHAGLTAAAKLTPMGCNVQQALAKVAVQGSGVSRGASMAARAMQLEIESAVAGGLKVTMPTAALKSVPLLYGRATPRFADFDFVSLPTTGTVATVEIVE